MTRRRNEVTGLERNEMLEWLRAFHRKAKRDTKSLTIAELDELCRIVALLTPEG